MRRRRSSACSSSDTGAHYTVWRRCGVVLLALFAGALLAPTSPTDPNLVIVFGAEACRLVAYDKHDGYANQTVIPRASNGGLDINAQICFFPNGSGWLIAGEDTNQSIPPPTPPPSWGIFQLQGTPGNFFANQIGRLSLTFQPNFISNEENFGCGFLADGRVVTTDIGDQYPPLPGNGQLTVWFPPFDTWSDAPYLGANEVKYCKIDIAIETAGGIYVDEFDNIYVASNRPSANPFATAGTGGVFVYHPPHPTSNTAGGGCGQLDGTGAPLASATHVDKEIFIPANGPAGLLTASAIARAPNGNFYVSSVFSGTIAEFDPNSLTFPLPERTIVSPPPLESPPYPTNGTPFGLGVDPDDGQIYYADLGIGIGPPPGPEDGEGDVYRVPFDLAGNPLAPIKINDFGFDYPEGIGVLDTAMLISPSPTLVRVKRTRQFTATGIGLGNTVVWSVEEGAAGGSITTAGGLYTAPPVAPPGGRAHVLATSVENGAIVGRAPVYIRQNAGSFP